MRPGPIPPLAVAVVTPWRPGDVHREAAWEWIRPRLPYEAIEGHCPPGPWVKALAVQDAIDRTDADVLIIHDADVWCPGIEEAAARIADRPVVIPHGKVLRLSQAGTEQFKTGERHPDVAEEHRGMAGGGIVIVRREVWDRCPLDPRFVGWGQEDSSWARALEITTGKLCRFTRPLFHLWHPPQPRLNRAVGSHENRALADRYDTADLPGMEALLTEARDALRRQAWRSPRSTTSKPASAGT